MTKEQKDILKVGNDLLLSSISNTINSSEEDKKQVGREYLKKVFAAGEALEAIETKE